MRRSPFFYILLAVCAAAGPIILYQLIGTEGALVYIDLAVSVMAVAFLSTLYLGTGDMRFSVIVVIDILLVLAGLFLLSIEGGDELLSKGVASFMLVIGAITILPAFAAVWPLMNFVYRKPPTSRRAANIASWVCVAAIAFIVVAKAV